MSDQELRAEIVQILFKLSDWMDPVGGAEESADALLAKYRIVPIDKACADTSWFIHEPKSIPRDCQVCHDQYREQLLEEGYRV